jgi:flagellar hook-associated protein 3 FlgL
MAMRVASFATTERMIAASMRTQAKMAEMQLQQASGLVSTDYSGLSMSARTLINLEVSVARSKTYGDAAEQANYRVQTMYEALGTTTTLLSGFRAQITAMRSTDRTPATSQTLVDSAKNALAQLANEMNKQYEGRYLFGGSVTTSPPVDLTGYTVADPAVPSTNYYGGDGFLADAQVSVDHTVSYGVTADNPAFEKAFRAINMLATFPGVLDDATLETAYNLITTALDDVTVVQSKLSVTSATLESAVVTQDEYQLFVATNISNIKEVDAAELTVQLAAYDTQLQASYGALAKIQSLSLASYLR